MMDPEIKKELAEIIAEEINNAEERMREMCIEIATVWANKSPGDNYGRGRCDAACEIIAAIRNLTTVDP